MQLNASSSLSNMERATMNIFKSKKQFKQSFSNIISYMTTSKLNDLVDQDQKIFLKQFRYGTQAAMWSSEQAKKVVLIIDPMCERGLWVVRAKKCFYFDLTYTKIIHKNMQINQKIGCSNYFTLAYFDTLITLIFNGQSGEQRKNYILQILQNKIASFQKDKYPVIFSLVLRSLLVQQLDSTNGKGYSRQQIIDVSQQIFKTSPQENLQILLLYTQEQRIRNLNTLSDYFLILSCKQCLIPLFLSLCQNKAFTSKKQYLQPWLSKTAFHHFLYKQQNFSKEQIEQFFRNEKQHYSFADFCTFLYNQDINYAMIAQQLNTSYPIIDYYCYSSHNTYLTGNQLTSDCKIERYSQDLADGIKCVELDVHNRPSGPIIAHAFRDHSIGKQISFEETIIKIKKYSDQCRSHLPIILSIENHTKGQNRLITALIIERQLKDRLFLTQDYQNTLKLQQLRGKIIIKTDSKLKDLAQVVNKQNQNQKQYQNILNPFENYQNKQLHSVFQQKFDKFKDRVNDLLTMKQLFQQNFNSRMFLDIDEMSKITGIFKSPQGIQNKAATKHCCTSLATGKLNKTDPNILRQYTRGSWLRSYPESTQISSGNYYPIPMLAVGTQIIALNTQTSDQNAWMLYSYFVLPRRNLLSFDIGYELKPEFIRTNQTNIIKTQRTYKISVLQQSCPCKMIFKGLKNDMQQNRKSENGIFTVKYWEISFIFLQFENCGQCLSLRHLRSGYRVVVGRNKAFHDLGFRAIIRIQIQQQTCEKIFD